MIIDSIYEGIIAKLTEEKQIVDISKKLFTLKSNSERVFYLSEIIESLKAYPDIIEVKKDEKVSVYYRNLGNKCYQKKKVELYEAWQYYNLALMHAPPGTESYCLAISNRSAVFQSMAQNKACLKDINKALSLNCPNETRIKLKKRRTTVLNSNVAAVAKKTYPELLEVKSPKDEKYLCASNKLKVLYTEEMGRHVVANEDIEVGEVLVSEEPYSQMLVKSQYLFACSYCFSRDLNLLPCEQCCFTLYCSDECKQAAYKSYHSVECPLMPSLMKLEFTKLELLALRTVIQSCHDYDDWVTLFKVVDEADKNMNTERQGCIEIDNRWVYDSKYYPSIHTLATNVEKRSISDIFQKSVTAAVFLDMLKRNTYLLKGKDENEESKILEYVAGCLLLHNMTTPTNMHGLSTNIETKRGEYTLNYQIGSAAYAFHSLLNHSCAPNVVRVNILGTSKISLVALRPIKKGMQLFDNYGQHHALAPCMERRSDLIFQYKFKCECEACINYWPLYFQLESVSGISKMITLKNNTLLSDQVIDTLQKGDFPKLKLYKDLCNFAEILEPYSPCKEVANCQESIKQCLFIFGGMVNYGYSKEVAWKPIPRKL